MILITTTHMPSLWWSFSVCSYNKIEMWSYIDTWYLNYLCVLFQRGHGWWWCLTRQEFPLSIKQKCLKFHCVYQNAITLQIISIYAQCRIYFSPATTHVYVSYSSSDFHTDAVDLTYSINRWRHGRKKVPGLFVWCRYFNPRSHDVKSRLLVNCK